MIGDLQGIQLRSLNHCIAHNGSAKKISAAILGGGIPNGDSEINNAPKFLLPCGNIGMLETRLASDQILLIAAEPSSYDTK